MTAEMLSDRFTPSDPAGRPLLPLANGAGGGDHACGCGGEGACVCGGRAAAPEGPGRIVELPGRISFSFDDSPFAEPKTAPAGGARAADAPGSSASPAPSGTPRASKIAGLPGGAPVTVEYGVAGMTCGRCVAAVRREVRALDRVLDVDVVLRKGGRSTVIVTSAGELERSDVAAAVDEAGYELLP